MVESFTPLPFKSKYELVLWDESGIQNIIIAHSLLNSIILPVDFDEYIGVSSQTLANHFDEFHYKVNFN